MTLSDLCNITGAPNGATEPENKDYAGKSATLGSLTFTRAVNDVVKSTKGPSGSRHIIEVDDDDQDMETEVTEASPSLFVNIFGMCERKLIPRFMSLFFIVVPPLIILSTSNSQDEVKLLAFALASSDSVRARLIILPQVVSDGEEPRTTRSKKKKGKESKSSKAKLVCHPSLGRVPLLKMKPSSPLLK